MLLLFFFIILNSTQLHSEYHAFDLDFKNDLKLQPASYYRYVRPQVRSIVREYYSLYNQLGQSNEYFTQIWSELKSLQQLVSSLESKSSNDESEQKNKRLIYQQFLKIDKVLFNSIRISKQNSDQYKSKDDQIFANQYLTQLSNTSYFLIHKIEEEMILYENMGKFDNKEIIEESIKKMISICELLLFKGAAPPLRNPFNLVFQDFIIPLEKFIIEKDDSKFLISRLGKLNMSWNSFHMSLEKEHFNSLTSKQLALVEKMHRRWNSILKIILR